MKTEIELNKMILDITNNINKNYPELLKYLNEMPITVPYAENPEIAVKTLSTYYESLVNLVNGYTKNTTNTVVMPEVGSLPVAEIAKMELNNVAPSLMVKVNGITVSFNDVGLGDVPIIFLHGYPFDKTMWQLQLDYLKATHRVIAYDIRAFGKSTDEISTLSMDLFADDLVQFMDKLKIKKAVVCGLSMGGFIALNALNRFADRFAALILCDTQCIADTTAVKEKRYKTIEEIKENGAADFNEGFVNSVFYADSLLNKKELVETVRGVVFANSDQVIMAGLVALAERAATCYTLEAIKIPTLIICGRQDVVTPLAQSEFMQQHIKGSSLKIIESAGHVSNLEHPDEFNTYLLEFLNTI